MTSFVGPDVAPIQCYTPDGCCAPSPCVITEDEFICAIRALLPEGDLYNTTLPTTPPETELAGVGAATVGCSLVGCEQLVFGSCCAVERIPCDTAIVAPQIAPVDAFAAVAFLVMRALCQILKEMDPCTAELTLQRWGERFGLVTTDLCAPKWSDDVLRALMCEMIRIRQNIMNWDYLTLLAARFGASMTVRAAGDFSHCGPSGWWTMARDVVACDRPSTCPEGVELDPAAGQWMRLTPACLGPPDSLNLIIAPADITSPQNCNLPAVNGPHDPEMYEAFKWLLPRILSQQILWCIYERDPLNCIV